MSQVKLLKHQWTTVSRLLDQALALAPSEHGAWLDALDASDESAELKQQMRQLLQVAAGVETADFLDSLPRLDLGSDFGRLDPNAPVAGMLVGPYRLLRELGVGGMGSVWLTERNDGGLKRSVALKLPQLSWSGNWSLRLQRERDILASLDHPNIARIYDAGVDALGRPYLALEYVEGQAIDAYCKANALTIRQRLQLILQVARAVAHAHARLVVHRDLKPANILVTANGQARLLDFGIAKLLDGELTNESALTRQVGHAMTLDYASPEQIRGEAIGTASDVYSLGVVAYELLAQARPYQLKRQSAAALEEAIALLDVRPASSATGDSADGKALKGDLDAILNKALQKDVTRRYPTMDALALDIERHLMHLPVLAQADTWGYRAGKFLRRNRLTASAAAAVGFSLLAGLSVATWQARAALAQADRAEQIKAFVLSIFSDADTDSGAGVATTAVDLLKLAQARVGRELVDSPQVQIELSTALGYSLIGQGLHADAAQLMQSTVDQATRLLSDQHALTNRARGVLAEALLGQGRNDQVVALLLPTVQIARDTGDLHTLIAALSNLSSAQLNLGQADQGVESARQSVRSLTLPRRSGLPLGPRDTMTAQGSLANALGNTKRIGGVSAARLALAAAQEIQGQRVTLPVLDFRTLLAQALVFEGQAEAGLRELDGLIPAASELLGPKHRQVSTIASLVGTARAAAGDLPGAIAAHRLSMEIGDAVAGDGAPFERAFSRLVLAGDHAEARQPERALPLLEEAVKLFEVSAGPEDLLTLLTRSIHASQLAEAGRLADAEVAFTALTLAPWPPQQLAAHQGRLSALRVMQGRHAEALQLADAASRVFLAQPSKLIQAKALALQGRTQLVAAGAASALAPLHQAQALFKALQVGISPDQAEVMSALGRAYLELGDASRALPLLEAASGFWQVFDPSNRRAAVARQLLAQAASVSRAKLVN